MSKFPKIVWPGQKSAVAETPPDWRVDFRRKDALPDTKVIRTDFLLNYGLAAFALLCLGFAVSREVEYRGLRAEIRTLSGEIQDGASQNGRNLADSGIFSAHMKAVEEFVRFKEASPDCIRVVSAISSLKAEGLVIRRVLVDESAADGKTKKPVVRVLVLGGMKGISQAGFQEVGSAYDKFIKLPVWAMMKGYKINPRSPLVVSNTQNQSIDFTFELTLEAVK